MFSGAAVAGVSLVVLASALLDASSAGAVSSALTITSMPGTVIEVAIAVTPAIVAPVLNFLLFFVFSFLLVRLQEFVLFSFFAW
ncbi:predicted protein [Listeria monocytogenes FSL R2-503]|nr:predicted protein [Listeria monocytogenes FSL R2-503]